MTKSLARAALWQAMVERAEALNDAVVSGQRQATLRVATQIQSYAEEICVLARAARVMGQKASRHDG